MNWALIFSITNSWALLMWLILAFAPRQMVSGDGVLKAVFYGGVGLLAVSYVTLIIPLMAGWVDPGSGADTAGSADLTTLQGVKNLFATDAGTTIGWIHYLAFDLFVGLWIARNADRHGIARWVQVPILFFALMFGPLGLVLYLALRFARQKQVAQAVIPQ